MGERGNEVLKKVCNISFPQICLGSCAKILWCKGNHLVQYMLISRSYIRWGDCSFLPMSASNRIREIPTSGFCLEQIQGYILSNLRLAVDHSCALKLVTFFLRWKCFQLAKTISLHFPVSPVKEKGFAYFVKVQLDQKGGVFLQKLSGSSLIPPLSMQKNAKNFPDAPVFV